MLQMPVIKFETTGPVISDGDYYDEFGINHGPGTEIDRVIWAPVNCGYHETDYPWGKLYQWGRMYGQGYSDSEYSDAIIPQLDDNGFSDINSDNNADKFFTGTYYYPDQSQWNAGTASSPVKGEYDPCPEGWRVPTKTEMNVLMRNGNDFHFTGTTPYSEEATTDY